MNSTIFAGLRAPITSETPQLSGAIFNYAEQQRDAPLLRTGATPHHHRCNSDIRDCCSLRLNKDNLGSDLMAIPTAVAALQGVPKRNESCKIVPKANMSCKQLRNGIPVRMLQFPLVINSASRCPRVPSWMEMQLHIIILVDLGVKSVTCKLRKSL